MFASETCKWYATLSGAILGNRLFFLHSNYASKQQKTHSQIQMLVRIIPLAGS